MAGKRKQKRPKEQREDLSKPSKWRLQHGGFSAPIREADPETGSPVEHRRAVGTLGMMLANGTITPQMHEAGQIFRTLFRSAALDGIATSQLIRLAGATADAMSSRQIDARRRVANAIDALGGHDSPAGSCVWFVVGLEFSAGLGRTRRARPGGPGDPRWRARHAGDALWARAAAAGGVKRGAITRSRGHSAARGEGMHMRMCVPRELYRAS
ncbi:hypothetical protein [Falsiroseomonas sp.]|uniref:hypothetical protein n=1 Tax=Falsiroseomonas sp. TaxID=2870721 RepID=UPI00356A48D7